MQALDLYARIEKYLDFEEEIHHLYKTIGHIVLSKEITNLIDIGCGQGEFCNIMNYNGIKTFGVDLSEKQIELALEKSIDAKCIDIKDITTQYQCATATFDVLNYIQPSDLSFFLQNCYKLLQNNGYFIFDINSLYGFQEIAQGTLNINNDENFIAIDANFEDNILSTDISLFTKIDEFYKRENGTIMQYFHSQEALTSLLHSVGFEIEEIVKFHLHSCEQNDKQIYICKKG